MSYFQASRDFTTGKTTAKAGTVYSFGSNIGYSSTACTLGYWPPGPDCNINIYYQYNIL